MIVSTSFAGAVNFGVNSKEKIMESNTRFCIESTAGGSGIGADAARRIGG